MVQNTDTHMGTHTHMGEQEFWPIRVYGLPVRVWAAHMRTGIPYAYGLPVRVWAAHMHMGQPIRVWAEYLYGTEHHICYHNYASSHKWLNNKLPATYVASYLTKMCSITLMLVLSCTHTYSY